jgi:hypothetical protein
VVPLIIVVILAIAAAVLLPRMAPGVHPEENPNANNPDALEADLDPEGDEPEGY